MTLAYAEAVYRLPAKLTASECAVLAMLALMADEDGACWPKQGTVADRVRLHVDTVKTVLRDLHTKGLIRKEKRTRDDGSQTSSMLVMTFPPADLKSEKGGVSPPTPGRMTPKTDEAPGAMRPGGAGADDPPHESSPEDIPPKSPKGDLPASIRAVAGKIRDATPKAALHDASVGDIGRALKRAVDDGADPDEVAAALRAYYADPDNAREGGRFAKAPHRMIQADRWRTWVPDLIDAVIPSAPPAVPPAVMAAHLERVWTSRLEDFNRINLWKPEYGPKPGQPGCAVPPHIVERLGIASW